MRDAATIAGPAAAARPDRPGREDARLLTDAVQRCVLVSQNTRVRAMLVHALHDRASQFYEHYGYVASPVHPMTLMLRLSQSPN